MAAETSDTVDDEGPARSLLTEDYDEETASSNTEVKNVSITKRSLIWRLVKGWWKTFVIIATPVLFSPIPLIINDTAAIAFYAIAIIAVYWITEAIPLAATALLPLFLFPGLGILSAEETAINYLNDTVMLFVGGLMVAVAIEKWNLHKRMALLVLISVGSNPKWLLLGFMSVTAFVSMWISNTATAALMLPIAHAVLQELKQQSIPPSTSSERNIEDVQLVSARYSKSYDGVTQNENVHITTSSTDENSSEAEEEKEERKIVDPPGFTNLTKGLMLGIAYSANIGGTATLTGTGPNLVFSGDIKEFFPEGPGINFALWFAFACPVMIICLIISWIYLSLIYCNDCLSSCKKRLCHVTFHSSATARSILKKEYTKLGSWKFSEILLLFLFILLALLWLFREPRFITGWGSIFKTNVVSNRSYFSDTSTVMFIVFLMFILPAKSCCVFKKKQKINASCSCPVDGTETLLDWNSVQHKLPWSVVLLLGSGFALADGAKESGLSCWLGNQLVGIDKVPNIIKSLSVSVIIASITEVISNVATTTLFLPILAQLSVALSINPFYLMLPATISASFAFMLPVATPPNAMAFSYGYLKVYDMVLTGILMNIICIIIVNLAINSWAVPLFDLHTFPNWTTSGSTISSQCNYTNDNNYTVF